MAPNSLKPGERKIDNTLLKHLQTAASISLFVGSLLLVSNIAASWGQKGSGTGSDVQLERPGLTVKDGWYGVYDPSLPSHDSMWSPTLVKKGVVLFDGDNIEEFGCSTDDRNKQPTLKCGDLISRNQYVLINLIQILKTDPTGRRSALTWYKPPGPED